MSKVAIPIGVIIAGLVALFVWMWGAQFAKFFWVDARSAAPVLILFLVAAVLVAFGLIFDHYWLIAAAVLAVLVAIFLWVKLPYDTNRQYVSTVEITSSRVPSFDERAPLRVADASSSRNMGDTTGTPQATKSLADSGKTGQWNTLIVRKGLGVGYEAVQQLNVPLFGNVSSSDVTLCKFSQNAALRIGGALPNNGLGRMLDWAVPANVGFDEGDAYSYCKDGIPFVVQPLKELDGFYAPVWKAYGVAIYNGKTGHLSISTSAKGIPGPVYPISLAQQQRTAYQASGSWWDYIIGVSGYADTTSDEGDPNAENPTEMSLRLAGGDTTAYATPLTPRGSSSSVVALATVKANSLTTGKLNPVVIHKYSTKQVRVANTTVEQNLKSAYSWMPDWSSGLKVFEIVPSGDGEWTASLGQSQSVVYRATIKANGSATLYNAQGNVVTRSAPGGETKGNTSTSAPTDLSTMTPAQLQALANQIIAELEARATAGGK